MSKKNALIIGGSGQDGAFLAKEYLERDFTVFSVSRSGNPRMEEIGVIQYKKEIKKLRKQMLTLMIQYKDPAYEAYRDRNKKDVISNFMKLQKEKAKNTGKNVLF